MSEERLEAHLYWGGDLEAVTYSAVAPALRIGDLGLPPLPFEDEERVVTRAVGGRVVVVFESLRFARFELRLAIVSRDEPRIPRTIGDGRVERALLGAAALHALFAVLAFHGRAAQGDEEASARAAMAGYLAAIDARANDRASEAPAPQVPPPDDKGGGDAAQKSAGAAGNPTRTNDVGRAKETKGSAYHATRADRGGAEVSTFGILSMIAADRPGENAGSTPWAKDLGPAAMGNMFGATIDDAVGNGGLGLSGNGEGGGGRGRGISLDALTTGASGTCGDDCVGGGRGHRGMRGPQVLAREHRSSFLFDRCGDCTMQVNGRLPPEAIQRVVRASFGRFRGCYEQGLQKNPGLEGRVAVKFVIARDGSVAMASVDERSLEDESVAKCVQRAFYGLAFPQPEGGIITVVYPIVFSTS